MPKRYLDLIVTAINLRYSDKGSPAPPPLVTVQMPKPYPPERVRTGPITIPMLAPFVEVILHREEAALGPGSASLSRQSRNQTG
jgi:hypothetical protein